jgi:hypothetical protein
VIWLLLFVAVVIAKQVRLSRGEPVWVKKPTLVWIDDRR